ncbi:hypothetical protein [Auritidibacter ignavus]|nr:hypothetical protein [Auritidibacter ignavus]WGH87069.1 hypothetical protein QDX24_04540 [Auritidibacter ignavus]
MGEIEQIIERMEQGEISRAKAEELILFAQEREDDARRRRIDTTVDRERRRQQRSPKLFDQETQ